MRRSVRAVPAIARRQSQFEEQVRVATSRAGALWNQCNVGDTGPRRVCALHPPLSRPGGPRTRSRWRKAGSFVVKACSLCCTKRCVWVCMIWSCCTRRCGWVTTGLPIHPRTFLRLWVERVQVTRRAAAAEHMPADTGTSSSPGAGAGAGAGVDVGAAQAHEVTHAHAAATADASAGVANGSGATTGETSAADGDSSEAVPSGTATAAADDEPAGPSWEADLPDEVPTW